MKLRLETLVEQTPADVFAGFNHDLFNALNPPFPPAKLLRYDGETPGDEVHIQLNFFLFKQLWISHITESHTGGPAYWFIDQGHKLPFFLRQWEHRHLIEPAENGGSRIVDAITFRTPWWLPEPLMWLALWGQFAYRKPIYKRWFKAGQPVVSPD